MKTPNGLKTVMSVLAEEEKSNDAFVSAPRTSFQQEQATLLPPPVPNLVQPPAVATAVTTAHTIATVFPATALKLNSIIKSR